MAFIVINKPNIVKTDVHRCIVFTWKCKFQRGQETCD